LHPEEHFVGLGCFCGAVRAQTDRKPVDWKAMARLLSAFRRQAVEACQGGDVIMESISPTIGIVDAVAIHVNKRRAPLMQASLRSSRSQLNSSDFNLKEENGAMKQTIRFAVAAVCLSFMSIATAIAQDQYTEGGVTRVTLVQILPGRFNAFMDDLKTNLKPIWDAEKKAGLIENYNIFLNTTKANPDDWDIGFALSYKNFAALDGLAQKVLDLRMKQYGDKSKEQQVIDKRVQNARVVTSVLTREITLK